MEAEIKDRFMTKEDFLKLVVDPRLNRTKKLLLSKSKEYAPSDNVFHNFNKGATMDGISPEQCLWDYMRKHLVSIHDMIKYPQTMTREKMSEKIGDLMCYLLLLEGLFSEPLIEILNEIKNETKHEQNS